MNYKTNCPACHGHNFYVTPHNGIGYCFNCTHVEKNINGVRQTYKRKIESSISDMRDVYTQTAQYYHSCLQKEHLQYLYQRGFTDESIERMLIGFCPSGSVSYNNRVAQDAGLVTSKGVAILEGRITFPYLDVDNKTVVDIRGRALDKNNPLKYKGVYGRSTDRGANLPFNYNLVHDSDTIIISEGEVKSAIGVQYGYPITSLPGITNWRSGLIYDSAKKYIILFDNQLDHLNELYIAIKKVIQRLPSALIATLPLFAEKKHDVDSFLIAHGKRSLDIVINSALPVNQWMSMQAIF